MISQAVTELSPVNSSRSDQSGLTNTPDSSNSNNRVDLSFGDVFSHLGSDEQTLENTRPNTEGAEKDQAVNKPKTESEDSVEALEFEDMIDISEEYDDAVEFDQNHQDEQLINAGAGLEATLENTNQVANTGIVQNPLNQTNSPDPQSRSTTIQAERMSQTEQVHNANSIPLGHSQHAERQGEAIVKSPAVLGRSATQGSFSTSGQNRNIDTALQANIPVSVPPQTQETGGASIPASSSSHLENSVNIGRIQPEVIRGLEPASQLQKPHGFEAFQHLNGSAAQPIPILTESASYTAKANRSTNAINSAPDSDEQIKLNHAVSNGYVATRHYGTKLEEPQSPKPSELLKPPSTTQVTASDVVKQKGTNQFEFMPTDGGDPVLRDSLSGFSGSSGSHSVVTSAITLTTLNSTTALSQPNGRAIAEAAVSLTDKGGRIDVTLAPEELGRVTVKMDQSSSALVIVLSAERPETLDLIRRNIDLLEQQATALGHEGASFSFEQSTEQHNSSGERDTAQLGDPTHSDQAPKTLHLTRSTQGLDIRM